MKRLKTVFKTFLFAYFFACLAACALQRQILYHPTRDISGPEHYGLERFREITLTDEDGTRVDSWYTPAESGYPVILYFHGNGGTMANRADYFGELTHAGFGLLAIDYRGYGASKGNSSESGLYQDARAAMHYAVDIQQIPLSRIILYGESLGTGVAVQMATEFHVAGLVLQSPYTSIEDIAKIRFPWLPVHYLLIDRYDSFAKVRNMHLPLLILHGQKDTVIPVEYGERLFKQANEPKELVYFPEEGHNDLDKAERIKALQVFCRKYHIIP